MGRAPCAVDQAVDVELVADHDRDARTQARTQRLDQRAARVIGAADHDPVGPGARHPAGDGGVLVRVDAEVAPTPAIPTPSRAAARRNGSAR